MNQASHADLTIPEVCKLLHEKGYLAASDGNVSFRQGDEIFMTPSGIPKFRIQDSDLARVHLNGDVLSGNPSSEKAMHLEVYRKAISAKAVVHAHPPVAIALSIAYPEWKFLPSRSLSEVILAVGDIPIAPYARPGTEQMGEVLRPFLPDFRVMILSRHGAISWGETLSEAYAGIERLEHSAGIIKNVLDLGPLTELSEEEVNQLREIRKRIGPKTF